MAKGILVGLMLRQSHAGGNYHPCKEGVGVDDEYEEHVFTKRGLDDMQEVMPIFLNLTKLFSEYSSKTTDERSFRVLEQGCGSARGLLEAQSRFPAVRMYGTNLESYGSNSKQKGYGQVDDKPASLLRIAKHFDIPLMCDAQDTPVLPFIYLTSSIVEPDFEYPFPAESFDLILSRDSLNSMKVRDSESHVYIPLMLKAMKQGGGMAALHVEYGANLMYPQLTGKAFTICGIYNMLFESSRVSIVVYKGEDSWHPDGNFYKSWFGIVMKRCKDTDNSTKDCIIPENSRRYAVDDIHTFQKKMSSEKLAPKNEASVGRIQYAFLYMENLVRVLEIWQQNGNIFM